MFMMFHSSARRRPCLIAFFALTLLIGVIILTVTTQ